MGTAAAIPEHLLKYAEQATSPNAPNSRLYRWIQAQVKDAVQAYRTGARDFGNKIPGLTVGDTKTIDQDAIAILNDISKVDGALRAIGEAFAKAGREQLPPQDRLDHQYSNIAHRVTTTDETLAGTIRDVYMRRGRELGEYVNKNGWDDYAQQMLAERSHDPYFKYFAAGFVNSLNRENTKLLVLGPPPSPWMDGDLVIKTYVQAYASGMVTENASRQIVFDVGGQVLLNPKLIHALQQNAGAAYHFVRSLGDGYIYLMQIGHYITRLGEKLPDGLKDPHVDLINLMTAGVSYKEISFADRHRFYLHCSRLIQLVLPKAEDELSPGKEENVAEVIQAIGRFVGAYGQFRVRPPGQDESPESWAQSVAATFRNLMVPWLKWFQKIEQLGKEENKRLVHIGFAISVLVGVYTLPMGAAWALGVGTGGAFFTSYVLPNFKDVPDVNPAQAEKDLGKIDKEAAKRTVVMLLLASGAVTDEEGNRVPLTEENLEKVYRDAENYKVHRGSIVETVGSYLARVGDKVSSGEETGGSDPYESEYPIPKDPATPRHDRGPIDDQGRPFFR